MSLQQIKQRDELLTSCVHRLKMTVPQLLEFSRAWEHPFDSEKNVWRRLVALGLERRVRHVAHQSLHDQWTLDVFVKIARDAIRAGFPVTEIAKEHRIGDGSRIRADMKFVIHQRRLGKQFLYYQESQESALTYVGWKAKLTKYLHYRRRPEVRPFRVVIVMENESSLNTVLRYAREVMEPHPKLTLFLFAWQPDLMGQYNVVTEDVWRTHRYEPVTLVPV